MAPSEPLVVSRQQWSRCVYITAIATFILLWIFAWSWQSETIIPTSEREPQWPLSEEYTMEPMMALPANSEKLCTSDAYNVGKWVKKPIKLSSETPKGVEEAAGYHCAWNFPHKCYRRLDEKGEFNRSVRILDYKWQPSDCDMLPFDAHIFANYLANHPLLFVGDSINQLAFESMACLLGESLVDPSSDTNMTGGNTNFWAGQKVHKDKAQVEGAVTLGYLRTDYLVRLDDFKIMEPFDDEGYLIGKGSNFPWVHALHRFDHIVINTGPHWHTDKQWGPEESDEELMAAFKKAMRIVFDYLLENLKPTQRVWVRSSPYGHAKCSQYTKPDQIPHPPTRKPGEYQWDMHEKFDQVWRNMIESAKDSRIKFFNVSPMSNLRGDAHSRPDSDCLHTCLPGPVDDWNKLLFQEIALEAAPKA